MSLTQIVLRFYIHYDIDWKITEQRRNNSITIGWMGDLPRIVAHDFANSNRIHTRMWTL